MTVLTTYNALGEGVAIRSGNFSAPGSEGSLTLTYSHSEWQDHDTILIFEEYNYGELYFGASADHLYGTTFLVTDYLYQDQWGNNQVTVTDLNLKIDTADDFSRGVTFTNMWNSDDTFLLNDYSDYVQAGAGDDIVSAAGGRDKILGQAGDDSIFGGIGNDKLFGGTGADELNGGAGRDRLIGGGGHDILVGGGGADKISGGAGRDIVSGGRGNDRLTGGSGADAFVFSRGSGHDRITDFQIGTDKIAIGKGASHLGQLSFDQKGSDAVIRFANVQITVEDVSASQLMDSDNFLF